MNSSAAARLCRTHLLALGPDPDAAALADVVWLALQLAWHGATEPDRTSRPEDRALPPARFDVPPDLELKKKITAATDAGDDAARDTSVPLYPVYARHPFGTIGASRINIPAGEPLPQRLQLERALKPFKRRLASRQRRELDPVATAEASAEWRSITPVYRASPERWFEVALLAEDSDAMQVWGATLLELQRMLARHGAFRHVRLWRYALRNDALILSTSGAAAAAPRVLVDPQGRRLCWFLTTGTSPLWRHPALIDFADTLGRFGPTTIVQLMPRHAWPHTLLGEPSEEALSRSPGVATVSLWLREPFSGELERAPDALTVPVTSLEPARLAAWARFAMASRHVLHPAARLQAAPASGFRPAAPSAREALPRQRIAEFRTIASPPAFRLLRLLSGMPLSLPVMRLMQMGMPERAQVHLAEILLSGLIERITPYDAEVPPELVEYDFLPGIREELADSLTVSEGSRIEETVAQISEQARRFVEAYGGSVNASFPALAPDPMGEEKVLALAKDFLRVSRDFKLLPPSSTPFEQDSATPRPPEPIFGFLSENAIKDHVLSQDSLELRTSALQALLFFETSTQHSWLLASDHKAFLLLDDANTQRDARLIQRSGNWFDMLPIRAEAKPDTAPVVFFGGADEPGWYYSTALFPSPSGLEEAVAAIVPGGADGAIVRLRALALEYDEIRARHRPSQSRTNAMQDVVNRMAKLPPLSGPNLVLAASNTAPGVQLIAIVSLQRSFEPGQLDWLFERIAGGQAFLAYQAGLAVQRAAPGLSQQERMRMQRLAIATRSRLLAAGLGDGNVHSLLEEFAASPRLRRTQDTGGEHRRILIGSTGWSLASYRTHAATLIEEFGHEVLEEVPIESVDQLRRGLARFVSCDLVLFIVGTGDEYVREAKRTDPNQLLLIELEYHEAARLGKPMLVMMREEDVSSSTDNSASGQMVRFRQMLLVERKVRSFRTIAQFDELLRYALRDVDLANGQVVEQVPQRPDSTPVKPGGLAHTREVEEVADLLSAFATQMHQLVMRRLRADNEQFSPSGERELERNLLDAEIELRQQGNRLYANAANCVVHGLDISQQDLLLLIEDAVSTIAKTSDLRSTFLLARRLLGLAAALSTGKPASILRAIEAVKPLLGERRQVHTPSQST